VKIGKGEVICMRIELAFVQTYLHLCLWENKGTLNIGGDGNEKLRGY
jgi:hypothetical protein